MKVDNKQWTSRTEQLRKVFACCNSRNKFELKDKDGTPQSNPLHFRDVVTPPHSPSHEIHRRQVFQLQSENENKMKRGATDDIDVAQSNMQEKECRCSSNLNKDNPSSQRDKKVQRKMNYHPASRRIIPFMEAVISEEASSVYSSDDSSSHGRQEVKTVSTEEEILREDKLVEEILQMAVNADIRVVYRLVREEKSMSTILSELETSQ
jgi:hypothetical protein